MTEPHDRVTEPPSVLACVVWDANDYPIAARAIWEAALKKVRDAGGPLPERAPGSTRHECAMCSVGVAIGPRQAAMIKRMRDIAPEAKVVVMCMLCTLLNSPRPVGEAVRPADDYMRGH